MVIENKFLTATVVKFHYKEPTIDKIGYDNIQTAICVPRSYFISAHAPTKLSVKFKSSGKVYVNCNINRTTGKINESLRYIIKCGEVTLLNCEATLEHHAIQVIKDVEYIFDITTSTPYAAHTIWTFFHPNENLSFIEEQALIDANKVQLDPTSDYSLFIQTCNPRKKMAFRCLVSFLNNVVKLPKKIVICSLDDINDGGILFPDTTTFINGRQSLFNALYAKGASPACLEHIFSGFKNTGNPNMWLKYIVPRLCFGTDKVLVLDDDVAVLGKCEQLLNSDKYLTFMNDAHPFYGERTIKYFNDTLKTTKYAKNPPFVCAGVYMMDNSKRKHDPAFINGLILKSEHDTDEQSAVGMEIIDSNDYLVLKHPEYHHGGWEDQTVDMDKLNLMHMQGRAAGYRENVVFTELFLSKRIGLLNEPI
jgi:hypothetical protein